MKLPDDLSSRSFFLEDSKRIPGFTHKFLRRIIVKKVLRNRTKCGSINSVQNTIYKTIFHEFSWPNWYFQEEDYLPFLLTAPLGESLTHVHFALALEEHFVGFEMDWSSIDCTLGDFVENFMPPSP